MKIGVITDCFKLPLDESLCLAGKLGFDGVQIYATTGEFSPQVLTEQRKAELKALLAENGLTVSALCGDMGGHGFEIAEDNKERIEKTKAIIELAAEFGAPAVTTHIGVIPADTAAPRYEAMLSAMCECGKYAAERGITLAIETGPETPKTLFGFLEKTEGGVGVNLDPANLVMVTGEDPCEAVRLLGKYIVHTHAKDGKMLKRTDPEIIYAHFADGGIEALNVADYFIETPLGEGDVELEAYLAALKSIGYEGFLTIERETGDDAIADITLARDVLKRLTDR